MIENSDTHYITLFVLLFAIGSILAVAVVAIIISVKHRERPEQNAQPEEPADRDNAPFA